MSINHSTYRRTAYRRHRILISGLLHCNRLFVCCILSTLYTIGLITLQAVIFTVLIFKGVFNPIRVALNNL